MEFRKNVIHGYTLNMFPNIPFKFEKKNQIGQNILDWYTCTAYEKKYCQLFFQTMDQLKKFGCMIKGMFKYKNIIYVFVMNLKSKNMFVTKILYKISIEEDVQGHYPEFRIWNIRSLMLRLFI